MSLFSFSLLWIMTCSKNERKNKHRKSVKKHSFNRSTFSRQQRRQTVVERVFCWQIPSWREWLPLLPPIICRI